MIEEANWLNLDEDLEEMTGKPEGGFDAVICLGNSFAHLPDFEGHQVRLGTGTGWWERHQVALVWAWVS